MKKATFYLAIIWLIISPFVFGQSYTLEECVRIALQNKETIKIAALDVKSAIAQKKGAWSNILPSLRMSGGWSESRFPGRDFTIDPTTGEPVGVPGATISSLTTWSSGASLNQTIYDGGGWWNRIAEANNNYLLYTQLERQTQIDVILEVHRTFFQLLKAQQLLDVARMNLDLAKQQVELVQRKYDLGAVKKTDLLKAEVQKGRAEVDLLTQESAVRDVQYALRNAMGLMNSDIRFSIQSLDRPLRPVPEPEDAYKIMDENNPGLEALNNQVTGSEINYKLARGVRLPVIGANFSYSASSEEAAKFIEEFDQSWRFYSQISLSIPLFTGFDASTKIQQAKLTLRQQQNDYISQRNNTVVQLESVLETLRNYRKIIPLNEEILVSAEEDLNLVQERYNLGSATILEVLDAQVSVTDARSKLVATRYDARIQEANLRAILGTLDKEFD